MTPTITEGELLLADPTRRRAAAVVLSGVAALILLWSFPIREVKSDWRSATKPAYEVSRLESYWDFFAPEVLLVSRTTWVEIERVDGSVERWDYPGIDEPPLTYRSWRWLKFADVVYLDEALWPVVLDYVVANDADPSTITTVRLIGAASAPAVGESGPFDPDFTETTLLEREVSR